MLFFVSFSTCILHLIQSLRLSVTDRDMMREHHKQVGRRKAREAAEREKTAGAQGAPVKQGKNKRKS